MSSRADAPHRAGWLAVLTTCAVTLCACFDSRRCGDDEICNYADDDCDGRYDEDFRDETGRYASESTCGGCGIDCDAVFPVAAETACDDPGPPGIPACRLVRCEDGFHVVGTGSCAPDVVVLCHPCERDEDCGTSMPGSGCRSRDPTTGIGRCFEPCDAGACGAGFDCVTSDGRSLCIPADAGFCACGPDGFGERFGCLLTSPSGLYCEGAATCEPSGLGACEAIAVEDCDGADDDCDGTADEDFLDASGRYVAPMHCGGCNRPCAPPGANMRATCVVDEALPDRARCETACIPGYVDVDGILANGCECARWDGTGPPPSAGADSDCDGVVDDSSSFVYVASTGNDANPGTLALPKRTIGAGIVSAAAEGKSVLVARGVYDGPVSLVAGVSVYGGYRPDFRDRSLTLYPVSIVATSPGEPAVVCRAITTATRLEGVTIEASDASAPGRGSTAVFFDGCGPEVELVDVVVYAAHGSDGTRGRSSAEVLASSGGGSLVALDGVDGSMGTADPSTATCRTIAGGSGGDKRCEGRSIAGGDGGASGCPGAICTNGSPCANAGCTDFTRGGVCDLALVMSLATPNGAGTSGDGSGSGIGGEATYNAPTNRGICNFCDDNPTLPRDGVPGADGLAGADGTGGTGCAAWPIVDVATGRLRGGDGTDGLAGLDGAGGGGGSAGSGYEVIGGTSGTCSDRPGGSGGGGGSGGCGAPEATGGQGAGASVGVVVRFGTAAVGPTFARVRIITVSGGRGGDGGVASDGGSAGAGALGGRPSFWCARSGGRGGDGGEGGAAGGGGGGCGGGSHALVVVAGGLDASAYVAGTSALEIVSTGLGGEGGIGGFSPSSAGTDGLAGSSDARFVVP